MPKAGKFTREQFLEAIPDSGGVISTIARRVGCAWHSARTYIDKWTSTRQAWQDERERITDIAQSNVLAKIEAGDVQLSKWWLQVMRHGEYAPPDKHEFTGTDGGPLEVKYVNDWRNPATDPTSGPAGGEATPGPVQVAGGGPEMAEDDAGNADSGRTGASGSDTILGSADV